MRVVAMLVVVLSALMLAATWLGYPWWLRLRSIGRRPPKEWMRLEWWPSLTMVVVVRNAEATVRQLLENLLATQYPGSRRRILVVSDASTDFTDAIVRLFEHRGVELLRLLRPRGHAQALNHARRYLRNDVVVVVHPEARLAATALTALVAPFSDPWIGVTYGHEQAIEAVGQRRGRRDSPYIRYERMLRDRESRVHGTVSARRTLYAVRGPLFQQPVPWWASADFMSMLLAEEAGQRAVHVAAARCTLTRPRSLRRDYSRTVLSVARDVLTLLRRPQMLSTRRYGAFAVMLWGHKVGRWLTPWAIAAGVLGLVALAPTDGWARFAAEVCLGIALITAALSLVPGRNRMLRRIALPGQVATTTVAIAHAGLKALKARHTVRRGLEPVLS